MNPIQSTFDNTCKKIQYLFQIEFRKKIDLQFIEFYPEIIHNKLENYEIQLEFDILKEVDPDLDYIFRESKKYIDMTSNFFHEYRIDENGKLKSLDTYDARVPIIHGIDFLFGEKFIVKSFFRFDN